MKKRWFDIATKESLVSDIPAGERKTGNLFYSVLLQRHEPA